MRKKPMGDVMVFLPGIFGSVLERDGKELWAPRPGGIGRSLWSLGRAARTVAIDEDPWEVDGLGDGVVATRLMVDAHAVPGFWSIDGYSGLRQRLFDHFELEPGRSYVEMPYDWRRDLRCAARQLQRLVAQKLHEQRVVNPNAKLILLGHSMGGLVARYFLECLDGWKDTRTLVTFGTPHRGSLRALDLLANGPRTGVARLDSSLEPLLRSMTTAYQLLPIYPCVDVGGAHTRVAETSSIPGVDRQRAADALADLHRAIEAGVNQHDPRAYDIHSVLGLAQGTAQSASLVEGRVVLADSFWGDDMGGDGTVPRVSATPIETDSWQPAHAPIFSGDRHAFLHDDDHVQTGVLGILSAQPVSGYRATSFSARLDAPDSVLKGESLPIRVLPDRYGLTLRASVVDLATGRSAIPPLTLRRDADEVHVAEVPVLSAGDYRLVVEPTGAGDRMLEPVHALFSVLDDVEPDEPPVRIRRSRQTNEERSRTPPGGRVRALLVGIDAYRPPVNALYGCRNDIVALEVFLEGRVKDRLDVVRLVDDAATRPAVIDAFRNHLGASGAGDTAVFVFCGHGSEEPAPPAVAHLEPTGRIQTLLLHDSGRLVEDERRRGLADKELSLLIAEVAANGAHVVVILDCGHTGGGTRDPAVGVRGWLPTDLSPSSAGTATAFSGPRDPTEFIPGTIEHSLAPNAPHVALAACRSSETAQECLVGGVMRGMFSSALRDALDVIGPRGTYRSLLGTVRSRVARMTEGQRPELFPLEPGGIADALFLDGLLPPAPPRFTVRRSADGWTIDGGSTHGLRTAQGSEAFVVSCRSTTGERAGLMRVIEVGGDSSSVEPIDWMPDDVEYEAVVVDVPLPVAEVAFDLLTEGFDPKDSRGVHATIARALETSGPGDTPSPFARIVPSTEGSPGALRIRVGAPAPGVARIARADGSPITVDTRVDDVAGARAAVARIEHVVRWEQVRSLGDDLPSPLREAISVEVYAVERGETLRPPDRRPMTGGEGYHLAYSRRPDGSWEPPSVFVELTNVTDEDLHVAVLDLTDRLRCHVVMPAVPVPAGHRLALSDGDPIELTLPAGRAVAPGARGRDWLKILVSEAPIDAGAFDMPAIDEIATGLDTRVIGGPLGPLDRLAARAMTRSTPVVPLEDVRWSATTVAFETVVPSGGTSVSAAAPPEDLLAACDQGELVVFVGAGLAAVAGFPPWHGLVERLLEWAVERNALDAQILTSLRAALASGDHSTVGDYVARSIGAGDLAVFLSSIFGRTANIPASYRALGAVPAAAFVTTNYDRFLEAAAPGAAALTATSSSSVLDRLSRRDPFIFHLFGHIDEPSSLLFGPVQLAERLRSDLTLSRTLQAITTSRTLLFVGLGLDEVKDILAVLPAPSAAPRVHYALVRADTPGWQVQADVLQRSHSAVVLPYGGDDAEVGTFLAGLRPSPSRIRSIRSPRQGERLTRVVLENIGPIDRMELPLDSQWNVLLGDNGVGKSSVLKAIALVYAGDDGAAVAGRLLRSDETSGAITIDTDRGRSLRTELLRGPDGVQLRHSPPANLEAGDQLVIALPPIRSISWRRDSGPTGSAQTPVRPSSSDVLPLLVGELDPRLDSVKQRIINTDYRVKDALAREEDGTSHQRLLEDLGRVMGLLTGSLQIKFLDVDVAANAVMVSSVDGRLPIEALSQGTGALIGWVSVIVQRLHDTATAEEIPLQRPAVVLIDELDAHLHPDWQQQLIHRLTTIFPNVQFIATTHSPLIVGGMSNRQVTLLQRDEAGRVELAGLPGPPDEVIRGRADQLLTGRLFGLASSVDYDTRVSVERYNELLGRARTPEEDVEFAKLQDLLEMRIPVAATTSAEQRAHDLLDLLLKEAIGPDLPGFSTELLERARSLLDEAARLRPTGG